MQLSRGARNSFKINTVLLSYHAAAEKTDIYPTMMMIEHEVPIHFVQEFSLDARIYDRFKTHGAETEEEFLDYMGEGRYAGHTPNQYEVKFVLDQMQIPYFDCKGHLQNPVIKEVW